MISIVTNFEGVSGVIFSLERGLALLYFFTIVIKFQ